LVKTKPLCVVDTKSHTNYLVTLSHGLARMLETRRDWFINQWIGEPVNTGIIQTCKFRCR
jgi:hypothetical protein